MTVLLSSLLLQYRTQRGFGTNVISSAEIADDCVAKFTSLAVSDPERVRGGGEGGNGGCSKPLFH